MNRTAFLVAGLATLQLITSIVRPASAGQVIVWGLYRLGDVNDPCNPFQPTQPDGNDFVDIATSSGHSLALKANGSIKPWTDYPCGCNHGECNVPSGHEFVRIAAGSAYSLAITSVGSLMAWGSNWYGQCNVPDGNDFVAIATDGSACLAIRSDGSLIPWGRQIAPEEPNQYEPVVPGPPSGNDFSAVAVGTSHCLALRSDGHVEAWGWNWEGECNVPQDCNFVAIAAGTRYNLAIKSDGTLAAWGDGDGLLDVPDGNDFLRIAATGGHCLALRANGTLVAWGGNWDHQCDVPEGNDFVEIAAGQGISMALTSGGARILTVQTDPNGFACTVPDLGTHTYFSGQVIQIGAHRCPQCPVVYRFLRWDGDVNDPNSQSAFLVMDRDRTITAVYGPDERRCGDECHPILQGDLNSDCYINFDDFAIYCQRWLSCTHPDCD